MRRAAKVDGNHKAIVAAFRAHGCSVRSLAAVGQGVPDLLVGAWRGNHLVEVKTPKGKATEQQREFAAFWRGAAVKVVRTLDDVQALVAQWRQEAVSSLPEFDASDYERPRREARVTPSVIRAGGGL